jgi:hypothetical protein
MYLEPDDSPIVCENLYFQFITLFALDKNLTNYYAKMLSLFGPDSPYIAAEITRGVDY